MRPFIHTPDEYFDLGGIGEWPITFTALVIVEGNRSSVSIMRAVVEINFGDGLQIIDVTKKINASPYSREEWEIILLKAHKDRLARAWSEVGT